MELLSTTMIEMKLLTSSKMETLPTERVLVMLLLRLVDVLPAVVSPSLLRVR
jgi:hypothetical protein